MSSSKVPTDESGASGSRRSRTTSQGTAVRDALGEHGGFVSAQDVYADLRRRGHRIGLSTVYRHLQALTQEGVADAIHGPDGETTYRLCESGADQHHHHLVCRVCGRAQEIEGRQIERWTDEVARKHGYTEVDHTIEIFGVCPACAAAPGSPAG